MRMIAIYLDRDPQNGARLAQAFGRAYLAARPPRAARNRTQRAR